MTKYIPLQGKLGKGKLAIVDDDDFENLSQWNWSLNGGYPSRSTTIMGVGYKRIFMHKVLLPPKHGFEPDHKNRNKLDNRKSNLRYATKSQNLANKGLKSSNTSGYKGVTIKLCKIGRRFIAQAGNFYVGTFDNVLDAAKAYDKKAKELFGEFACLNFPEES